MLTNPNLGEAQPENILEHRAVSLLLQHHGYVFRQARRFAPLPDLAEDIAQQVLADFIAKASQWDIDKDIRPLLMAMTRRTAQNIWRERAKLLPETLQRIAEFVRKELDEDDNDILRHNDQTEALKHCMAKLPESSRRLLVLHYFEGVSTATLAEQLGKKANAICQAMFRARERLRTCIELSLKWEEHQCPKIN